jgi:hypothetical protein
MGKGQLAGLGSEAVGSPSAVASARYTVRWPGATTLHGAPTTHRRARSAPLRSSNAFRKRQETFTMDYVG